MSGSGAMKRLISRPRPDSRNGDSRRFSLLTGSKSASAASAVYVGRSEHVLRRLRAFRSRPLGQLQQRMPEMRVVADDEPRIAGTQTDAGSRT